ncbi:MAG: insulinase family protein [Verrucomicrobiales bacterium]|nr:insulinase family protein [Verrucomicrobiales bacterium]
MSHANGSRLPDVDALVTTLSNGLLIIVREDRSAPVASVQAWCRAGSIDEGRWLGAGLSHVLEHMLFKGTSTRGSGRIDQEVQDAGGQMNAYTSFDRTVYHINVPNTGVRVATDILCDIMQHATLPEDELVKELDVIRREMDMCHDDPGRRSSRRLFETAYTRSPYRFPIIGIPDIFNTLTREDVMAYYREKYAPNNLFMVVVGDVVAKDVVRQIEEAFASAKARPVPPQAMVLEPVQTAPREQIEEAPLELGHVHVSWHIPDLRHPDIAALDVLSVVLGSGRSSRLFREVRERAGLVHTAEAWTYNPGSPGLFGLSAVVDADKFRPAADAMFHEIARLQADGPSEAEVGKALKQITASTYAVRKTMHGQAQDLGSSWLAVGDLGFTARYLDAVKKVTPAEVRRVAQQYLTAENRTLCALLPEGSQPTVERSRAAIRSNGIVKRVLANGLRLLIKEDHRLPFVDCRVVFQGGVLAESPRNNGITGLMTKMLIKGTPTRTTESIATEIESVGGSLDVYAGNNSFGVTLEVLDTDLELGLDLMSDVILRPTFPEGELAREREYQLAGIRAQKDQVLQLAARSMRRNLFGEATYGLDAIGTEDSVSALGIADLREFHRRLAVPNNGVLAVYGRVDAAAVETLVERAFGGWAKGNTGLVSAAEPQKPRSPVRVDETRDKKQAVLVMGFRGTSLKHPDRYALDLIQESCSDLGSRLFLRIRDELGLAYYVGAQNFSGLVPGYFSFYAGTESTKADQVAEEFLAEIQKLRTEGLSAEELTRSKAKIVGQRKISRQDLGTYAMSTALDELYGLGYENSDSEDARIEAVTREDVKRVAATYLEPEAYILSIIRPANGAKSA